MDDLEADGKCVHGQEVREAGQGCDQNCGDVLSVAKGRGEGKGEGLEFPRATNSKCLPADEQQESKGGADEGVDECWLGVWIQAGQVAL